MQRRRQLQKKKTALRGKALTCVPTTGSSRQQVLAAKKASDQEKRQGKQVATSTRDESDDDECEEEPSPLKRARKSTDRETKPYANRDRAKRPTPEVFLDFLTNCVSWPPTRFGDTELMEEIGIDGDVKAMLGNMNMSGFYSFAHPTYIDLSCEFLASLVVTYHQSVHVRQGWGKITFKVKGRTHNISFKDIGRIFGFKDASDFHLPKIRGISREDNIPSKVWSLISGSLHSTGSDKSSAIRNPAVRYLHRMLVHAFFPRKEPGSVTEDDLKLLCLALKPFAPNEIPFDVSELYKDFGMVGFFVARLEYYRDWIWSTSDSDPQIGIGGMITPLLQFVQTDLRSNAVGPTFLDGTHMKVAQFFSGRHFGSCVYTFKLLGRPVEVILPNKSITCLEHPGAVAFNLRDEHFLGPHGKLGPMASTKRRKSISAAQYARTHQEEMEEDTSEALYGPPRYHFEPYAGALAQGPLREAHEHIGKLQRWNKAQDRAYYKLKTKYKEVKKELKRQAKASAAFMKKVTDILVKGGVAGCSSSDFIERHTSAPQPRPVRSPRSHRERARRNYSPPPSASGNKSPSFASSDDESGHEVDSTQHGYYITYPDEGESGDNAFNPDH